MSMLACGLLPADEPVALITGLGPLPEPGDCYTDYVVGRLRADPESGTTLTSEGHEAVPVMWQPGFTGRRMGLEVAVFNAQGVQVAVTGHDYKLGGAFWAATVTPTKENHYSSSGPLFFLACASVQQQ
jgi:hypothetical protein